jgi:tetratricopeptide (TPR) repeat protein
MRKGISYVAVIVLALAGSTAARADASADARAKFERGSTLYDLGKYVEAAHAYEEAYQIKNDPALLFNIGQAYRLGGDNVQALRAYRAFLRRVPDTPNRPDVERHIANLQRIVDEQKNASTSPPTGTLGPGGQMQKGPEPSHIVPIPPTDAAANGAALTAHQPERPKPLYKRWWLWTAVGAVAVAGVVVGVAVAATTPNNAPRPAGTIPVTF